MVLFTRQLLLQRNGTHSFQPTRFSAASSWSRIYWAISGQMLVGRTSARGEHNSAKHTIKCELINNSREHPWKVKRRIQSPVSRRMSDVPRSGPWASEVKCRGPQKSNTAAFARFHRPGRCLAPNSQSKLIIHSRRHPITKPLTGHTNAVESSQMLLGRRWR